MTLKTATIFLLLLAGYLRLSAQTAEVYVSSFDAAGGGTIYAASTMDASMQSGSCTHTYNWSLGLGGPAGVNQVGGGSDSWQGPTTNAFSETINSQIASNVPGTYTMSSSGTAFCSCVYEQFYTDPWNDPTVLITGPPTINSGGVGVYPTGGSGEIYTVEPGTTGQLAIYGTYLTAGGQDLSPTVTATNGITLTGLTYIADGQLNVSYNATNATPGTAYVTVKTNVGQTSPPQGSIAVGDMTPTITSISQTSFYVNNAASFTISGQHFGSKCTVAFPFPTHGQSISCTDMSISVNGMTPTGTGSGDVTVTAEGYGGQSFDGDPGQTAQSASSPTVSSTVICPTTISLASTTNLPLQANLSPANNFPTYLTGVGILSTMAVGPGPWNYTGSTVSENVTVASSNCPASLATCGTNATFPVGPPFPSGTTFGTAYPTGLTTNEFLDEHGRVNSSNLLSSGPSSCTTVCAQKYSCGGSTIGSFTLTYTFTESSINGTGVTVVGVKEQ